MVRRARLEQVVTLGDVLKCRIQARAILLTQSV